MRRATMKNKIKSTKSSGNVFADLGLPNADEHLIKADIVLAIAARIKAKGLTQAEVSKLIGLAQPDVSKLLRGHYTGYSFERLFGFLTALGDNVKIAVSPAKSKKHARLELGLALGVAGAVSAAAGVPAPGRGRPERLVGSGPARRL